MRRIIPAILLIALLAIGGGLIANSAYQAGLSTAVTTATGGGTVVVPAYGYGYGYGWHPFGFGFGFFGFLGTLLFIFLIVGLLRAIFFRGGPGRRGGWGPGWGGGPGGWNGGTHEPDRVRNFWESRFGESFEEWHRKTHDAGSSTEPPASNTTSKPA
jgi:hypothetical protein